MKDKKVEGIHGLANKALVISITDLSPYKEGRSTLEHYFPIGLLSKAVHEMVDTYGQDHIYPEEFDDGFEY